MIFLTYRLSVTLPRNKERLEGRPHAMSTRVNRHIAALFSAAERRGRCLVPSTSADAMALRRRIDKGSVISPVRGMFARASHWQTLGPTQRTAHIIRGLARLHPTWVFCSTSAAIILGLEPSAVQAESIHVLACSAEARRAPEWLVRHELKNCPAMVCGGVRVTDPLRTAYDCIRATNFPRGLAIANALMRREHLGRRQLAHALAERYRKHPGIARVLATCRHATGMCENGGEAVFVGIAISQGFERPLEQVEIIKPRSEPGHGMRADFAWMAPDGRIILGELDGREKYGLPDAWGVRDPSEALLRERRRESELTRISDAIVRFSYAEATDRDFIVRKLMEYGVPRGPAPRRRHGVPDYDDPWGEYTPIRNLLFENAGLMVLGTDYVAA